MPLVKRQKKNEPPDKELLKEASPSKMERVRLRDAWGQSPGAIARAEGLAKKEVEAIVYYEDAEWLILREKIRAGIVQRCYAQAINILDCISVQKGRRESNVQNAITAATLIDKARLLEGLPTSIVAEIEVDLARLMQPEVLQELIRRKGGIQNLKPEHRALAERLGVTVDAECSKPSD